MLRCVAPQDLVQALGNVEWNLPRSLGVSTDCAGEIALKEVGLEQWHAGKVFPMSCSNYVPVTLRTVVRSRRPGAPGCKDSQVNASYSRDCRRAVTCLKQRKIG